MNDDQALLTALNDEPYVASDPADQTALAKARLDIERIRDALQAIADEALEAPLHSRRPARHWVIAAAAALAILAASVGVVSRVGLTSGPTGGAGNKSGTIGVPAPQRTLAERVAASDMIIVGIITHIESGELQASGGLPYVLATVKVTETIKPGGGDAEQVVAFDYTNAGVVTSEGQRRPWHVGDEVLLFLTSDVGSVSQSLTPRHLQVLDGETGRYLIHESRLEAPFTLEAVRHDVS